LLSFLKRAYLKRKFGPPIIVVSGLPRSGTSMMMNMLAGAGIPIATDHERGADEDNPKGYFELERVKELDKKRDKSWLSGYRGRAVKIISFLLPELPDDLFYQVLFLRRDLREVIASQNKMLERRGEAGGGADDERMIRNYESHLRKVAYIFREWPNFEALDVDYRSVLEAPEPQARRVARFLGRPLDTAAMARVVDPSLYRNRQAS
jgi:hypothetical protein